MKSLFNKKIIRTGIDLDADHVCLVRAEGTTDIERFTHAGVEPIGTSGGQAGPAEAAAALGRLLGRLDLRKGQLGHIAASVGGAEASCRQVALPLMNEEELAQALPLEARKHLDLEGMESPVVDYQVLDRSPGGVKTQPRMLVLFAAVPMSMRDYPLEALRLAGMEPDVVDLQALSRLNALLGVMPDFDADSDVAGILHLGNSRAELHLWSRAGGLLSREIRPGLEDTVQGESSARVGEMVQSIQETLTFYRGRFRLEARQIYLTGPRAASPGLAGLLGSLLSLPLNLLDPMGAMAPAGGSGDQAVSSPAALTTACGLCRWWDREH
jgi:Tfp pilus assembly PilM family ATPase